jgi:hypothetical protein
MKQNCKLSKNLTELKLDQNIFKFILLDSWINYENISY